MKKIFYLALLSMIAWTASAQTIVVNYTPGTLSACYNRDTVSVTVTNSTLATVTNLRLEPTMSGFNFVSMVPVAGVSVTNPSNLTPQMTIASLAPAASVRIRYFVQSGCNSSSTFIPNVLKTSGGAVINTANTGVINVLFPSITMTGISNTSAANETSPGLLSNLVTEQVLVRGFTINSTNALVPLTQAKAVVLNQYSYYQFMGVNKGTFSQSVQGDTFTYTFSGSDFMTVGDGDTLLEVGENFTFYDTMRIKGCNTAVPSNLGLKYYATWGCFTSGAAFCDKSSDVNALGEAKVVPYALTALSVYSGNGFSNTYGAANRQSYCKPWEARTTYKNTTNNGGIAGAGTIYDLEFFQSSTVWPFATGNLLQGFSKNRDGSTQYIVDSIKINGVLVSYKDTTSSTSGSIFNTNLTSYDSVIKIIKLTPASYTSPTPNGLKDLDGDGQIDDLAEGDTVQIQVFYRMQGNKFTDLVNSQPLEFADDRVVFDYQQTHTSVYYRNMCKEIVLPRAQYNFHYNYTHFNQYEVGGTEDFYGGGAEHTVYAKFWNQYSLPYGYVDTQKLIFKTILPPGLNYVPGSVGKMVQQTPSISQASAPGTHWLNAAQQYEVNGPGDYDTVIFVFNNSSGGNNTLHTIPYKVTLDCASLADPCLDLYPGVALVQDSIRSYFYMQWISDGSVCYDELLMKDGSPIRKHCPANKKGYNLTAFDVKRQTIGYLPDYRREKITPSHPYIDSIDYSQTIPYDTVKYTIRGFVKDTAFNSGIAYAHFKNLYDNLDTIQVLPSSTIKIYDVSSGTTYNFFVTNAKYVRPVTGRGDIEINLGSFVDSVRATGNTTFMMGGETGSSVYTPDSFVIEFYGVLTHNSQREPYTNTQRDISPIGELKSEVAQVNQDCELWGRRLAVFQMYWVGQQIFDYTPNAATVGACDQNGNHNVRCYYWNLPSPDYFPFETRFSNRIADTWSVTYNPIFVDSIYGPYMSSFLSFNRNPSTLPAVADSNSFSRNIDFSTTHLPQNQRLIERYTNRIRFRFDSIYPKLAPTYTSDDYHHYNWGLYFRPTCALPLSIPYANHNNSAGSFMPNLFRGSFVYWHNRQMPRIFDSARMNGGTAGTWTSYSAIASNPSHNLTVNPSSANIAQKDTLEWTVTVGNGSTTAMPKTWLDFRAKSATIVRVVDIVSGIDMPLSIYAVGANQYKWAQVGNVPAAGNRQFRVFAKVNGCIDDTIVLREGFNCSYYPTDPDAGYLPPYNYKCAARENVALLPIQIPPGQIQVVMTSILPATGTINVCDTITIEYRITNLGAADLRKVNFAYTIPVTSNLTYVANSANYKWPATASYQVLPVVPTITGSTYNFDMTGYFKSGVLPNQTATGDSNSVVVRMKYVTGCPFRSGDQIFMNTTGERACGDVIEGNGFATLQLKVNGLPTNPSLTMEVNPFTVSDFGMCADTGRVEMFVRHTSGSTTNGTQYIQYEMPQNFVLTPGTVTVTNPTKFISTTPTVTTVGGKTILEWRFASNFAVNDTARIKLGITSTSQRLTCANNLFTKTTVLEKYPVSAACAAGGNCNVDFPIFTKEDTSAIQGGIISISNLAVTSSLINSPLGETVNYSYTVTNTGKATSNLKFKFMGGAFLTDSVFTHTVASLASGASTNVTGSYFAAAGKACALKVMLDSSVNCVCSYPSASVGFGVTAAKNDTTICSGTTLSVGMNPVSGYTYLWGDGNTTSNPSYTYTNTDPNAMDTVRNTLFITRMGCNSFDTIVVAVKPVPQGLDITADNTCLLTNPITFTASSTSSGVTYTWTFPGGGSSTTNPTDRTMLAGTQNVIINATKNGCSATYNENFVFYDLNISATPDNPTICYNTSTALRANSSNATNYQWYRVNRTTGARLATMGTAPTQSTGNITDTTRYRVVVTNGTCTDSSDLTVAVISNIVVGRVDTTICPGRPVILSVPFTFNTANWTNLQSGATSTGLTYAVSPTVTTLFRVVAETVGPVCTATDTVYVTVRAVTLPVVSGTRSVCSGGSATYTAAPTGTSPSWTASAGSITSGGVYSAPTVTSSTNAVITYSHTDVNGCVVMDTHNIVIQPLPILTITSSNASMCAGQTRTLTGTPSGGTFSGTGVSGGVFTAPTTAASYTITYTFTDGNGCVGTTTQSITVNPRVGLTAVTFSPTVVCVGSTTSASSSPSSGSWSVLSGPGTINAGTGLLSTTAASLITVRYTHPGLSGSSCPDTIQGTITPVVRPTVAPSASPTTICNGASTTIAANAASGTSPYTYAWNIGTGASHSQSPTSNTAYNVTVTDNNSCTATGTVNVTVTGSTPLAADAGSARAICSGASTSLGGSPTGTGGAGGYTYSWTSNPAGFTSTAANPSASPTATTTYTVTVTSSSCTVTSSVVVTVNPRPSVAPSASPSSICNGQSSTIAANATGGTAPLTYTWNIGSGASHSQSPTATTAYNVTVTDNNSCTASGTVTVNVTGSTPLAGDAGTARAICNGASTSLGGTPTGTGGAGGYTYSWASNPAGFTSTAANPSASPTATTTYTVTVTSSGCTVSSSVVVTVNPRPTAVPSATPATICNGQSSTIAANATGGTGTLTYTWNIGSGASHTQSPAATTAYNVTVTDANGCTATGSVTLNVVGISPLTANAGSARTICSGVTTNLGGSPTAIGGSGGYTYSWASTPAGFSSTVANPSASPTATTTYTVTVTSSTCTVSSSVVVTVNPSPAVAPSASASTICNGQSVTINSNATGGTAPLSYAWNNGSGASHTASPTSNTTYIVTVTDANSCTATGSVSVTVTGSTPLAADAGSARTICNGATTNLGGTPTGTGGAGGYTYSWSSNPAGFSSTIANPSASPTATTTYTVTVTSSGCTATSSVVVTVNPKPAVAPSASPSTLCNGQSTTIAANATGGTAPYTYSWTGGSGASFTATPSSTTSYSVTVTDANGCTASGSVSVVVTGTSPLVAVAGSARAICNGSSTTVGGSPTASGGAGSYTYAWSGGLGVTPNPVASPSATTWYRLTVTSSGCTAVDSVLVTVNPRPNVAPSATVTNVCFGGSSTVSANGSGGTGTITYTWSPSGAGASFVATPNATTIYNVTATDANGCTATGNVSVNVIGSSPLTANAGTNRTICNGSSTNLGATPTGTGGNTVGTYTYSWSSNPAGFTSTAANPTVSPTATTTYTVTVTNSTCTAANTVVVSVNPRPAAVPSASVNPVCSGSNTTITANASGGTSPYTYQWNTSQTSASFVASPSTTVAVTNAYTLTVTDVNGCTISATVNVNVTPLPVMTPIANKSVCIPASGGTVALSATAMTVGQTGAWSTITSPTGAVSFSAGTSVNTNASTLSPINTYTFRWTLTENGCSNWTNTNVTVNESPVIEAGMNDTICRDNSSTLSASLTSVSPATINWKVNTLTATPFAFSASTVVSPTVTTKYIFTAAITPCIVSDTMTVAVTTPPIIADDLTTCLTATEDIPTTFNIPATIGVNDNLSPVLKGGVSYKIVSSKNSTVSVSGNTVNYASSLNFNGRDTVVIEAYSNSCTWLRDTSMFCVNVSAVNDKPDLKDDTVRAIGSTPKVFNPLSNDSDVETTLKGGNIAILSGPTHGTLTGPAADGQMTYTASNPNLAILDTIVYEVCDSGIPMPAQCNIARIIVQVVPEAKDSTVKTTPGSPVTIGPAITTGPGVIMTPTLSGPSKGSGTASVNPTTGVLTFTPSDTPFIGKDTIRKVLCFTYPDGSEACDTSYVYISNPNVTNTTKDTTPMNTPKVVGTLKPYKFEGGLATTTTTPNATVDPITGAVTFTPKPGFVGIDTVKVTRCDSKGNCVTDIMVVTVTPNLKDTTVRVPQGLPITLKMPITTYPGQLLTSTVLTPTKNGTATVAPDGSVTYQSNPNFTGRDTLVRRICVYDSSNMQTFCDTIMEIFEVFPHKTNPDIAVGNIGETINGNVSTNDNVLPGTTYGSPVASSSNPSSAVPVMNSNGTYTFNTTVPGTYVFTVPVCPPGYTTNCPMETLTITIVDPSKKDNKPVVNTDRAITKPSTAVKVDVLANDAPGNIGIELNRASLTVATSPKNGTTVVNSDGTITYTPNAGFLGRDTFYYNICDKATPPNCAIGMAVVNVTNEDLADVRDDVAKGNGVLTGNVLSNDKLPAGSTPSVKPVDTIIAGKGRLVIDANGNYTWTPVNGYTGSLQVPVTVCDGKTPQTCYTSTLHIISTISADVTIPNYFSPNGDGINDVWNLDDLLDRYPNARAVIYNRWGNIVWRSTGPYGRSTSGVNNWSGQLEGSQDNVPDGVYYYLLEIEDEFKTTKTGFIEIMRQ